MIVLQVMICLIVPVLMWYFGLTRRNGKAAYLKKGICYPFGRAKASEQAWTFANDLFFNILRISGINIALISIVLLILVKWKCSEQLWTLCISLLIVEILAGLLFPGFFTNLMVKRNFDENGVLIQSEEEEEKES